MKKRMISMVLTLCLVLVLLPGAALATEKVPYPATAGNIYFDVSTGQITGCDKTVVIATIPSSINGVSVTSIGKTAFKDCTALSRITLPDTLLSIGEYAFEGCSGLSSIIIPDALLNIGEYAFEGCSGLSSFIIPDSVLNIGYGAFANCTSLNSVIIPGSITTIQAKTFYGCTTLKSIAISDSVVSIGLGAFCYCRTLADIYYSGSEAQWNNISIDYSYVEEGWPVVTRREPGNSALQSSTIHYNSNGLETPSAPSVPAVSNAEYLYDTSDPGTTVTLNTDRLNTVTNTTTAVSAVQSQVQSMTSEQKSSATGADLATLYAETAAARASSQAVSGGDILINAAVLSELEPAAAEASTAVEAALTNGGVSTARYLSKTVILATDETSVNIHIAPDVFSSAGVDRVRVETPAYALTFPLSALGTDPVGDVVYAPFVPAARTTTITIGEIADLSFTAYVETDGAVVLNMPDTGISNPIIVSLPAAEGDPAYQAVVAAGSNTARTIMGGNAVTSKYNPATQKIDGWIKTSGRYYTAANEKDFTDISNKSQEMQEAIRYLASKGIIAGRTATTFDPDGSITRAEIATLLVKALGKLDSSATANFTDVTPSNWYYSAAASSQKHGLINGFEDNTFRGTTNINKVQIVAVSSRVLTSEMKYKTPSNPAAYLSKYSDTVSSWAQPEVALATRENLVVYRTDGTFSGDKTMTRGDAAIIIYRLFQRIW